MRLTVAFMVMEENEYLNIPSIDEQHSSMVDTVNDLHSILGAEREYYSKHLVSELVKKLRIHFDTEEKYMKDNKFPNFISHKLEHDRFYNQIVDFQNSLENGEKKVNLELLNTVKKWFHNHLEINDRKIANFLHEKNIK